MSGPRGLSVAVLGVGYWGSKHLRVLAGFPDVEAIAVDPRLPTMPDYAHLLSQGRGFTDLADALPHVDAVVIATHPTSHARLAHQALAAGKHVLVEKPLATTAADASSLIAAADAAGLVLMVGHTFEHNPAVWLLRELVQDADFGDVYFIESQRLNLGLYQSDVNVILDLAPHDISIANFVLQAEPTSVTTWASRHVHPLQEDVAQLRLLYQDAGVETTVHVSWLHPQKVRRTTIVGTRQMVVYDDLGLDERVRLHDKSAQAPTDTDLRVSYHLGRVVSPVVQSVEPLAVQDRQFVHCILTGGPPSTDGRTGLAVVRVLEAAQRSLLEGRTVALAEIDGATGRPAPQPSRVLANATANGTLNGTVNGTVRASPASVDPIH
jgi:predicted dehydrogenase